MIFIFASLVFLGILSAILLNYADKGYKTKHAIACVFGMLGVLICFMSLVKFTFVSFSWIASKHKAEIINKEYGTNYTQEDVFYGSDVIETIRQIDRKRIEVNADINIKGEQ